ncbi:MAG: hypothetical protein ACRDCW_06560 [Sarcina sp.]
MSKKVNSLEKIFVVMVVSIMALGLFLQIALQKNVNRNKETLVSKGEKEYIDLFIAENKNSNEVEIEYLKYLEDEKIKGHNYDIARVNYFLGLNNYLKRDYLDAINYFKDAKVEFLKKNNYFYILKINNYLMQLFFENEDYLEAMKVYHQMYELLRKNDIKGMNKEEINKIKINTITVLLKVSSSLGMQDISTSYYEELLALTNETKFSTSMSIFAKYFYNFKIENFKLAEEYAKEYIKAVDKVQIDNKLIKEVSYLPLLNVYIESEQFEKAQMPFIMLEEAQKKEKNNKVRGTLLICEGLYLEKKKGNFQEAMAYYEKALKEFQKANDEENILKTIEYIVNLREHINVDLEYYIKVAKITYNNYNNQKLTSELVDTLNTIFREKLEIEQSELIEKSKVKLLKYLIIWYSYI